MHFDMQETAGAVRYRLLTSSIVPRPIAWISTVDRNGGVNVAPFSCFNLMSYDPPLVAIGIQSRPDGTAKDTHANIVETRELVVNLVTATDGEAMSATAVGCAPEVDEAVLAGLEMVPSRLVAPPRVASAPGSLECRTFRVMEVGHGQTIVLAEVLAINLRDEAILDPQRGYVDTHVLGLLGRMEGPGWYTLCGDRVRIDPPTMPPAMSVEKVKA